MQRALTSASRQLALVAWITTIALAPTVEAAPHCTPAQASVGRCPSPQTVVVEHGFEHWDVRSTFTGDASDVLKVMTQASAQSPGDAVDAEIKHQGGHSAVVELPIWC